MEKMFQRKIENFQCEKCGQAVEGDGYTNHCPACLTSKHVDINPGDRSASCGGMMEPVGIEQKRGEFQIQHRCKDCGFERKNKVQANDDMDEVIRISKGVVGR
jgi:hypothetical protein